MVTGAMWCHVVPTKKSHMERGEVIESITLADLCSICANKLIYLKKEKNKTPR